MSVQSALYLQLLRYEIRGGIPKENNVKKRFVPISFRYDRMRKLLPAVLFLVTGLCCGGCFTRATWEKLGTERSHLTDFQYEYSPDRTEIVFTCKKQTRHYVWPLLSEIPWNTYETLEKRIPLDPLPGNMVRFYLEAIPDSYSPHAHNILSYVEGDNSFDNPRELVRDGELVPSTEYLFDGDTVRLWVHPDDMPLLSEPYAVRLLPKKEQSNNLFVVFPYRRDGNRFEMLADPGGIFRCRPFSREFDAEVKQENAEPPGVLGWCWKCLWLPAAVVTDAVVMPPAAIVSGIGILYFFATWDI